MNVQVIPQFVLTVHRAITLSAPLFVHVLPGSSAVTVQYVTSVTLTRTIAATMANAVSGSMTMMLLCTRAAVTKAGLAKTARRLWSVNMRLINLYSYTCKTIE